VREAGRTGRVGAGWMCAGWGLIASTGETRSSRLVKPVTGGRGARGWWRAAGLPEMGGGGGLARPDGPVRYSVAGPATDGRAIRLFAG